MVRKSRSGCFMTISTLVESELENLFSEDDSIEQGLGFYNGKNMEEKMKKSEMESIQRDFEGLFK